MDDHDLTVIASDGCEISPIVLESFIIHPGERFDFILYTTEGIGNYWIRARTLEVNRRTLAEAILRYQGAPIENPNDKKETLLH